MPTAFHPTQSSGLTAPETPLSSLIALGYSTSSVPVSTAAFPARSSWSESWMMMMMITDQALLLLRLLVTTI
ncbi:hypothetical protein LINPERPRIM_LOCUS36274 [Linum perenne]